MKNSADLGARFATGVLLIGLACLLIYYGGRAVSPSETATLVGGWAFRIVVAVCAAVMFVEWNDIHRVPKRWSYVGAAVLIACLLILGERLYPVDEIDALLSPEGYSPALSAASFAPALPGWGLLAGASLLLGLASRRPAFGAGFAYIALPAFALLVLEWAWMGLTFWVMIVTWTTDICAYFAGRAVGGPKLAPRISPNKTWAGLIGGIVGAALFGWVAAHFFALDGIFLILGGPMAILAQAGDLFESWIKRRAGVKDSGTILPGHGGLLDRLDGLLPVLVATLVLLMLGLWVA